MLKELLGRTHPIEHFSGWMFTREHMGDTHRRIIEGAVAGNGSTVKISPGTEGDEDTLITGGVALRGVVETITAESAYGILFATLAGGVVGGLTGFGAGNGAAVAGIGTALYKIGRNTGWTFLPGVSGLMEEHEEPAQSARERRVQKGAER